jgi:hypothetical protein
MSEPATGPNSEIRLLVAGLIEAMQRLAPFGIASVSDYAEYLFEQATGGQRVTRGNKGYDVIAPMYDRIQVKCRRLPADGRIEQRLLCRNLQPDGFDYLGAVIFMPDLTVKCALLVSRASLWPLVVSHPDSHKKIAYQQIERLNGMIDFSDRIRRV